MPKPMNLSHRETKNLHADWWSDATDESGRYLERVTIFSQFLEADRQAMQAELFGEVEFDLAAAQAAAQSGDTSAALSQVKLNFGAQARASEVMFHRFVVEMTDSEGNPQPLGPASYGGLDPRDADFINAAINALSTSAVSPTPMDREIAAHNGKGVQATANDHFRDRSPTPLRRR